MSPLAKVRARLRGVKANGEGLMALCPSHPDKNPSLHVTEKRDGTVLLRCFAGCPTEDVVGALGLKLADLYPPNKTAASAKEVREVKTSIDPEAFWEKASPTTKHQYLREKGVRAHGELRVRRGDLLVPVRDAEGALVNVQRIAPDGEKRFLPGCPTQGGHYLIDGSGPLLVCEGLATGLTLAEETGHAVAVAFSAGNVPKVARALAEKLDTRPVIATDADEAGLRAAREAGGVEFIPPADGDEAAGTDWNDWARAHPGGKLARRLRAVLRAAKSERPRGRYLYSVDDLYKTPTKVDCFIDGYIEVGTVGQFFGPPSGEDPPSGGKTLLQVDVGCSAATGRDWCGKKIKQGLVVYLAGEGIGDVHRRIKAWFDAHGYTREEAGGSPIVVTAHAPLDLYDDTAMREFVVELEPWVKRFGPPVLIVLDTQKAHLRGDENTSGDITELIRRVTKALRAPYEPMPTLILAHHVGHTAKDRPRGHSSQMGDFDFYSHVNRQANGQVVLWPKKLKGLPVPPPLVFDVKRNERYGSVVAVHRPGAAPAAETPDPTAKLGHNQQTLLDALPADGSGLNLGKWRKRVGAEMRDGAFYDARSTLVERGLIEIDAGAAYRAGVE